jgi:hypothetical protein
LQGRFPIIVSDKSDEDDSEKDKDYIPCTSESDCDDIPLAAIQRKNVSLYFKGRQIIITSITHEFHSK